MPSLFSAQQAASDALLLAQFGETVQFLPARSAQYPLVAVIDRGEGVRAELKVYATAWSLISNFEGTPERGDRIITDAGETLKVADVKPDEFGGRVLYLVIS